jgi:hypothetical protein
MTKIRYTGTSTVRIIEPFEWNKENEYVQDVPDELAQELITYPYPEWEIAEEDPEAVKARLEEAMTESQDEQQD